MKALRWHGPRDLRLVDLVEAALQPGEVRIRVACCGICGSDLHEYVDGPHAIPIERPHPISDRCAPLTLGHEFCGVVVESADPRVQVGGRVANFGSGLIDPSAIVTRRVSLAQVVPQGFDALIADKNQIKVLVAPNGEDME